jgi:hypothetical protein
VATAAYQRDNDPGTGRRESPAAGPVDTMAPENRPDFTRPDVTQLAPKRERCRDLLAGTDAIHAQSTTYLPKWSGEEEDMYHIRATLTELYNSFGRCVTASVGLAFDKPPELPKDANPDLLAHFEDIDAMGTAAPVFLRDRFREGLCDGIIGLLVEYPKVDDVATVTEEDRKVRRLRPRWVAYGADQIINWRIEKANNKIELTLLVLHECVDENVGDYGTTSVEQYRVLRLTMSDENGDALPRPRVTFKVWRKKVIDNKVIWMVHEEGEMRPQTSIPFSVGYIGVKLAPMVALPPLIDLADLNIGHYRVSADRRYMLSICLAPTFVIEGWTPPQTAEGAPLPEQQIKLGPNAALRLPPNQVAKWVQAEPGALEPAKAEKDDLVAQMGAMSIAFLSQERKAQETATAHRINMVAQNASLSTAVQGMKDCVDQAIKFHCIYLGIPEEKAPEVTFNVSYEEQALDASTIQALNNLAKDNNLTRGTLLTILQRGRTIPDEINLEDEELELLSQAIETTDNADNGGAPTPAGGRPPRATPPGAPPAAPAPAAAAPIAITIPLTVVVPGAEGEPKTIIHKFTTDASGKVTGGVSEVEGAPAGENP